MRRKHTCLLCGRYIQANNALGLCSREPECKKAREQLRQSAERAVRRTTWPQCKICNGPVRRHSMTQVCNATEECRAEQARLHNERARNSQSYKQWLIRKREIRHAQRPLCSNCGKWLRENNETGICWRGECNRLAGRVREEKYRARIKKDMKQNPTRPLYVAQRARARKRQENIRRLNGEQTYGAATRQALIEGGEYRYCSRCAIPLGARPAGRTRRLMFCDSCWKTHRYDCSSLVYKSRKAR